MKNRYTPFGYEVKNGAIVIEPTEGKVVQSIFSNYLDGMSLRACSESPRVRMAPSDFSPDDAKTAGNTLCINEDFGKIWRKRCRLPKEACQPCVERF